MKKRIFLVLTFLVPLVLITLYLTFFYKNLTIINNDQSNLKLNDKNLGSAETIRLKVKRGSHFLWVEDKEITVIKTKLFNSKVEVRKPELFKITGFDATKMTPGVVGPIEKEGNILYLGGRELNRLLSFNLAAKTRTRLSEKDLQGAKNIKWNDTKDKVLILLDKETYPSPVFDIDPKSLVWLYEITADKLTPLGFSDADFTEGGIVGIKRDGIYSYNDNEYKKIKSNNQTDGSIVSKGKTFVNWDEKNLLIAQEGKKDLKRQYQKIFSVSLSSDGLHVAYSVENNGATEIIVLDILKNKSFTLPLESSEFKWVDNNRLILTNDDSLWLINTSEIKGYNLFTREEKLPIGEFFTDNDSVYFLHRGELKQIRF